ncbi:Holliday junction branch migration protein RuvA [Motiliproteus sp. MSK22-1]|uniref:Holliday junction branch migration protein RuvA n=1 Tax=Motiliproteus sp. MSK22-1 TaxID=1897630 RepID=UPI0009778299|nr:Holliday junction branch migration protein RuvA [Motiliproteus sp. MSK22-1]OMH38777.1 Holliday junction DNA helicase RuvA [Motiliproteus sp. MSK22-1]
MIGRIRGELLEKQPPLLVVDVQGVGYEIEAPMSTFYRLPELGKAVDLYTHFVVREDAQLLYGFHSRQERTLFRTLIKVNGVGPKLGLTILSGIDADEFARCVSNDDSAALVRLPGVGKKTAERLIVEMRDKLKDWMPKDASFALTAVDDDSAPLHSLDSGQEEAESALIALGYKPVQATKAVAQAVKSLGRVKAEELIRHALKGML